MTVPPRLNDHLRPVLHSIRIPYDRYQLIRRCLLTIDSEMPTSFFVEPINKRLVEENRIRALEVGVVDAVEAVDLGKDGAVGARVDDCLRAVDASAKSRYRDASDTMETSQKWLPPSLRIMKKRISRVSRSASEHDASSPIPSMSLPTGNTSITLRFVQ